MSLLLGEGGVKAQLKEGIQVAWSGKETQPDSGPGALSVSPTPPCGHLARWGLLSKLCLWQLTTCQALAISFRSVHLSGPFLLHLTMGVFSISTPRASKVRVRLRGPGSASPLHTQLGTGGAGSSPRVGGGGIARSTLSGLSLLSKTPES